MGVASDLQGEFRSSRKEPANRQKYQSKKEQHYNPTNKTQWFLLDQPDKKINQRGGSASFLYKAYRLRHSFFSAICLLIKPNPGVKKAVGQVNNQIGQHDNASQKHRYSGDYGIVSIVDGQ